MALTKILNDENKSFKPVLTDKLVYDTKPTVNSFNGITSDAVARAIAGASGEVPAVTEADNGKVLTAVYDEGGSAVEWADAQGGAEYSAGTGISISAQDEISVDTTVIATKNDLSGYQPTISDLETIRSGASAGATAVQPGSLATVATSGSYNDLSNKPSIPAAQVNSDWNAASGVSQILNKPSLATVATSGSYADLSNKPTIPTVDQSYNASSTNAQSGTAVAQAIAAIPSSSYTAGDGIDITANEVSVRAGRNLGFEAQSTTVTLQSPTASGNKYAFLGKLDADTVAALKSGAVSLTPKYDYSVSLGGVVDSGARFAICQSSGYNQPLGNGKWVISNNVVSGAGITYFTLTADTAYTVDFSSLSSKSTGTWTDVEAAPTNFYLALVGYSSQYTIADVMQFGQTSAISYAQNPGDVSTITIGDPNALYLYAEDQLPSTLGTAGQVLTVNSGATGIEWATPSGGGSSYTFSAPLRESSGTVVLDVDTDELTIAPKTTALSAQREISAAESGYAWYLGNLTGDTSDTVYTFTFNNVPVSNAVSVAVNAQGKHIYPLFVGETYGGWGNQWIIPTALTFNNNNTVSGSFNVCFKQGEQDYPTHLDSYGNLSWASVLVFAVASDVPSAQVSSSNIYGSTTSGSSVSYSTGGSMLMVKHPVPAVTSGDNGKVLKATYSNGAGSFGWDTAPSELPSVTGNAGKLLAVNSGATGVEWINAPTELPSVTGNAGKILAVNSGATGVEWANAPSGVELITVTSIASSNASTLYNAVDNAVTAGKLPVLVTANSSNANVRRYWHLNNTNSWDSISKWYLFRCVNTVNDQSTSKYTYVVNELNVGRSTSSSYGIECNTMTLASGLTSSSLNPFNA